MTRGTKLFAPVLAIAVVVTSAWALTGGGYDLTWNTIDGGGGTFSTGGGFELGGTIGQSDAGAGITGGTYSLTGGFWPGAGGSAVTPRHPVAWRSIRNHSGIGDLPIALNAIATGNATVGSGGPSIETRGTTGTGGPGITRLQVVFNDTATLPNTSQIAVTGYTTTYSGGIAALGSPVAYAPSTATMANATTMEMTFSPALPDQSCFKLTLGQTVIAETIDIVQDRDVVVRALNGDANLDGKLTITDVLLTKSKIGASVDAGANVGNAIYDDNLSGAIDTADVLYCKTQFNAQSYAHSALCP